MLKKYFGDSGESESGAEEQNRLDDLKTTSLCLLGAATVGGLFICLRFILGAYSLHQKQGWIIQGNAFTCLLWGSGWFAAAFVFGFLFGIPKVLQTIPKAGGQNSKSTNDEAENTKTEERPYPLKVNTNLEEISDWLTKILVGATLTQLIKVPRLVTSAASYMAKGIGGSDYETIAAATLLYFASIGFFSGYVLTRMFFSLAFARVDQGPRFPDVMSLKRISIALGATSNSAAEVEETIQKLESVRISDSLTTPQILAVAKGANIAGNASRAMLAARLAVARSANDPESHLNLAVALHNNHGSQWEVIQELKLARQLVDTRPDSQTREDIYNSIIYLALYLEPPTGFERAIQDGEQFLKNSRPTDSSIWMNMACAYGQKFSYYQGLPDQTAETKQALADARNAALRCINEGLKIDSSSIARFNELYHGTAANPEDNDLQIFENDKEFDDLFKEYAK